jgi:hypothetical protein
MSWDKQGQQITALYQGYRVQGVVESSRVKYGGSVQHLVKLDKSILLAWRFEPTDRLLIDDKELIND